ncbi:MAG: hypothetical protein ACR2FN_11175 [Chitinophagaceae bacterium]
MGSYIPHRFRICLKSPARVAWKALKVITVNGFDLSGGQEIYGAEEAGTLSTDNEGRINYKEIIVENTLQLLIGGKIVLSKAKILGIHTDVYELPWSEILKKFLVNPKAIMFLIGLRIYPI